MTKPGFLGDRALDTAPTDGPSVGRRAPTPVSIELIGGLAILVEGAPLPVNSRKLKALIAYLALQKTACESRERLATLLWSEGDGERPRNSLRQAVAELRSLLGPHAALVLDSSRLTLGLRRGATVCDVDEILAAAERGEAHDRLLAATAPIESMLAEVEDVDSEFRVWLRSKRRALADQIVRRLEKTIGAASVPAATQLRNACAVLAIDGAHEVAARALMTHYASEGAEVRALQVYNRLWRLLDDVYDSEPSAETQALVAQIKRGERVAAIASPPRAPNPIGLFVGPLEAGPASGEDRRRLFAFRRRLIASLVRFREWRVFDADNFVLQLAPDPVQARMFRIDLAPVDDSGLAVTLEDALTGQVFWSEIPRFEADGCDEAHARTIRRLATTLNAQVNGQVLSARSGQDVETRHASRDIYDRWFDAYAKVTHYTTRAWDAAREEMRAIVDEAPDFPLGLRSLAQWENALHICRPGVRRSRERHRRAAELARRALDLDPVDSRAHLCLAWSLALGGASREARAHAEIALELNDGDAWTLVSGGNILGFCGDIAGAVAAADAALGTTPTPSRSHLAYDAHVRFMAADEAACLRALDQSEDGGYAGVGVWRVAALARLGKVEEAATTLDRVIVDLRSRWAGDAPALDEEIFVWLSDQFPIFDRAIRARLQGGLTSARDLLARRRRWRGGPR